MNEQGTVGDPAATAPYGSLPVQITFDLGSVTLSLAQLQALRPGMPLTAGGAVQDAVNIRANGALIGRGELVEIDGKLGVMVAELHVGKPTKEAASGLTRSEAGGTVSSVSATPNDDDEDEDDDTESARASTGGNAVDWSGSGAVPRGGESA